MNWPKYFKVCSLNIKCVGSQSCLNNLTVQSMHLNHYVYLSTGPHWKLLHILRELLHILSLKPSHRPHLHPHWGPYGEHLCHSFIPQGPAFTCGSYWTLEPGRGLPLSHSSKNATDVQPCEKLCNPHRRHQPPLNFLSVSLNTWQSYLRRGSLPKSTVSFPFFPYITFLETVLGNSSLVHLCISVCYIRRYFCWSHFKLDMVSITSKNNNENGREF